MDNFDLRKYLAENRLFNFRPKLPITDYVDIDQEELNQLYDRLKDEFEGNVGEFIEEYGQDFLSPNIEKINKYYGAKVLERDIRDDFFLADGLEFISSNERFEKWLDRNKEFYLAEGLLFEEDDTVSVYIEDQDKEVDIDISGATKNQKGLIDYAIEIEEFPTIDDAKGMFKQLMKINSEDEVAYYYEFERGFGKEEEDDWKLAMLAFRDGKVLDSHEPDQVD